MSEAIQATGVDPQPTQDPQPLPADPTTCRHLRFDVQAHVNRVELEETGSLASLILRVSLRCQDCASHFWFPGLPTGLSHKTATTSPDGFVASLPAVRDGLRCDPDPSLANVLMRGGDITKGRKMP